MILLQDVVKGFGDVTALDHVNLEIRKGSIYGLLGPNGAGKSTMLRLICGVYSPDEGAVTLDGNEIFERPEQKQRIFFVSDEPYFLPQASLDGMAKFYAGLYPNFDPKEYERLCEVFRLPRKKRLSEFSKGMKRQAAFLLGLSTKPEYLLLDECFDGLDPVKRQVVRKILSDEVCGRGLTVLVSSHNLRELDEICDTVCILYQGGILYTKDLDDLKGEVHKIQAVFMDPVTEEKLRRNLNIMAAEVRGKFFTLIVRGELSEVEPGLNRWHPAAIEAMPLTLEEVFLYEMEVKGYDAQVIFG